ncbi:hypothetical protein [Chitinophaga nivalis]|uniref:Uncharacterized protein n=1 Tax=Chitinophaga nivalis TaxID=2991709 RepID=A0ABT3ING1_9BACT|nr:hypothetical protein [Chitinophaga nivalis]MCW3464836.1 hypothetical protein [Chitinophaga nivalis]MCW3485473.1 hypothetical protein [Chitinophaga nivalis]
MENLLTILTKITSCSTSLGFVELCEYGLSNVIGNNASDNWSADQRADFMLFYTLFRDTIISTFKVRDALRREGVENLTTALITELESDLYKLTSFESGIEIEELVAALDQYITILIDDDEGMDGTIAAIAGNYFKTFFLTLHALGLQERMRKAKAKNNFVKLPV